MSWDQPEFSFDHGQPPTPSRTPTSPSFGDLFQTPRIDSSFLDSKSSWNNSDASNNYADILKTPRALLFSTSAAASPAIGSKQLPTERQERGSTLVSNAEKLLSTPSFEGLQADQTPRFGQSAVFGNESSNASDALNALALDTTTSFKSTSSMQTPPPTSTSATKRKGQQSEGRKQPSKSANDRRMSVPIAPKPTIREPPGSQLENTENNQSSIFSPSVFGYDFDTPATAPAYPQAKLLWGSDDQSGNLDFMNQTPGLFSTPRQPNDPFGFNETSTKQPNTGQNNVRFAISVDQDEGLDGISFAPGSSQRPSSSRQYNNAVNPNLLFSSPSKVPGPKELLQSSHRVLSEDALQPYAYQMQEAKRERASNAIGKIKKRRKPSIDSPAVQAALENLRDEQGRRPHLRRSMTDSALPPLTRPGSSAGSIQRRSSPLKRQRDTQRRAKRTSIALTIDENGRARTETRVIDDGDESADDAMDIDQRSDGSSSSSSEDENDPIPAPKPALPRLGRFTNSASHSKKSSYTSLYSSASCQEDPKLPDLKARSSITTHGRSFTGHSLQPLKEASFGSNDGRDAHMDSDGEDCSAQSELRRMAQRRQSGLRVAPFNSGNAFGEVNESTLASLSPTTVTDPDLTTPISGPSSTSSGGIRCVCNVAVDDGQMIQW